MTWSAFSDDFSDDCWSLSDAAYRLHSETIQWNSKKLLDCLIPKEDLRRYAKRPEAVEELLAAGFWVDEGECWRIVHHAKYQPTRDKVLAQQAVSRENGKKGGRPRKPNEVWEAEKPSRVPVQVSQPGTPASNPEGTERNGKALRREPTLELVKDNEVTTAAKASSWPDVRHPGSGGVG